jgi:hypothetical protein
MKLTTIFASIGGVGGSYLFSAVLGGGALGWQGILGGLVGGLVGVWVGNRMSD